MRLGVLSRRYAIALQYDRGMEAPVCLAKGVDAVVCTSGWFHARAHLKASLPGTVMREGKLLHAA